jgi:ADP-heptose:LPS heptosyltransferase
MSIADSKMIFEKVLDDKERALMAQRNLLIESSEVGDKPFNKEFYQADPLVYAMDHATHFVIVLSNHIGDATLSLPLITSLVEYFRLNSLEGKKITIISAHRDLFESLRSTYPGLNLLDKTKSFHSSPEDEMFCFNLNRKFNNYSDFGIDVKDQQDPRKVFRHDCQDWVKEEIPIKPGTIKKYDMLPLRIMRNLEILFGQKLYKNVYDIKEFIPKEIDFEDKKESLIRKFNLDPSKQLIVISPGSTAKGKEYKPESWEAVVTIICEKRPDIQIFFIDDPNKEKRSLYGSMVDRLKKDKSYPISRGSVELREMNTLMHMSRLSVTPDTGLGHYSSMCGVPNVMFSLSNSIFWSGPNTVRVTHPYGRAMIHSHALVDLSFKGSEDLYYYGGSENKRGASDISPENVAARVLETLR